MVRLVRYMDKVRTLNIRGQDFQEWVVQHQVEERTFAMFWNYLEGYRREEAKAFWTEPI